MVKNKFNKIRITGASGSGKSYLGQKISSLVGISLIQLDALRYDFSISHRFDNKNRRSDDEMVKLLKKISIKDKWVIEGGYFWLTKDTFDDADVIIFLRPCFSKRLFNVFKRFFQKLFGGKYEGLFNFFSLISYNFSARRKWCAREKLVVETFGSKVYFFKSANDAFSWFVNQK